jgi:hypothetical protein
MVKVEEHLSLLPIDWQDTQNAISEVHVSSMSTAIFLIKIYFELGTQLFLEKRDGRREFQ